MGLTVTHCNTLQHTVAHCTTLHIWTSSDKANTKNEERSLQHTTTACRNTLQHSAHHLIMPIPSTKKSVCNTLQRSAIHCSILQRTATHHNTLQHTATRCNTLQHTATHRNALHHTATHCNALHHSATHCNTLQHTGNHMTRPTLITKRSPL